VLACGFAVVGLQGDGELVDSSAANLGQKGFPLCATYDVQNRVAALAAPWPQLRKNYVRVWSTAIEVRKSRCFWISPESLEIAGQFGERRVFAPLLAIDLKSGQGFASGRGVIHWEMGENILFCVLIQLIVIIGSARLCNNLTRQLGQPGVVGEIVAGLALGPSCFGYFFPQVSARVFTHVTDTPIGVISQLGLVLLMFQIGTDFDFSLLRRGAYRHTVGLVTVASVMVPLVLGVGFGLVSAHSLASGIEPLRYSLFCGVAVAITAVPILGRILVDFRLTREPLGVIAISAAALNDVVGWLLLACVSAYAAGIFSSAVLFLRVGAILAGVCLLWYVLRPLVAVLLRRYPLDRGTVPPDLMAIVLCMMFSMGLCTSSIGIFTIFGGFATGLLFQHNASFVEAWNRQVGHFVLVFFLPVFFTYTGLRTNLLGLSGIENLGWLTLVLALSIGGKILPVYAVGRFRGFGARESKVLGVLMNTRALMELIVINIGYNLGVLPAKVFTMLVIMAVTTTVMTGPLLRRLLPGVLVGVPQAAAGE
jgi:Kef-type K+ transport system membrane component KefB